LRHLASKQSDAPRSHPVDYRVIGEQEPREHIELGGKIGDSTGWVTPDPIREGGEFVRRARPASPGRVIANFLPDPLKRGVVALSAANGPDPPRGGQIIGPIRKLPHVAPLSRVTTPKSGEGATKLRKCTARRTATRRCAETDCHSLRSDGEPVGRGLVGPVSSRSAQS
jgi:hypothetical protein